MNDRFSRLELDAPTQPVQATVHATPQSQGVFTPFSQFIQQLADERKLKHDSYYRESAVRLKTVDELMGGKGRFEDSDAMYALVDYLGISRSTVKDLIKNGYEDHARTVINSELDKREIAAAKKGKTGEYLLRYMKRADGSEVVRRILTDDYGIINNDDVVRYIAEALPKNSVADAITSHSNSDMNHVSGNLILPDHTIKLPDSDYSFGLAYKNDEIGEGTVQINPFVFRGFCFNGLIYSKQAVGVKVKIVHRGKRGVVDQIKLKSDIKFAVMSALSLSSKLPSQLDNALHVKVTNVAELVTYLSKQNGLTMPMGLAWWKDYQQLPNETVSGVVNALTSSAKAFTGVDRYQMESVAGNILTPSLDASKSNMSDMWSQYIQVAKKQDISMVQNYLMLS